MKRLMMLAVAVAAAMMAMAETEKVGGYTWTYRINGDTAEIYGVGNPTWSGSRKPAISPKPTGVVAVPSALGGKMVTSIGRSAFLECNDLTDVNIPDGVTNIGDYAFYRCTSLTSISIPNGVTNIGRDAFCVCTGLKNIDIPQNVRNIGYEAFAWCGFSSVVIPDCVSNIEGRAFFRCNNLESVTLGTGLSHIGSGAFENCSRLTNVYINDLSKWCGISFEDSYANPIWIASNFYINGSLMPDDVAIPDGVTSVGDYAFYGCKRLVGITIPKSLTRIGKKAFFGCSSLSRVNIADIRKWCAISFADFESNPLYYARTLYLNGVNVTTLTIPDGVTSIGRYAFIDCRNITKVIIPNSVTNLGGSAFAGCNSAIYDTKTVPGVQLVDGWAVDYTESITDDLSLTEVHGVADYAFSHCSSLKRVVIGDAVVHLGAQAFMCCSGLADVIIGDKVASIRESLFLDCTNLTNVVIGNSVISIDEGAFLNCRKLARVVVPDSVTNIAARSFSGCKELTSITVGASVARIGVQAFAGCKSQSVVVFKGRPPIADNTVFGNYEVLQGVFLRRYANEWHAVLDESRMWHNLQMRMEGIVILTFDPNCGSVEPSSKEIASNESVGPLPVPIRNGFIFNGWWTAKEGGSQVTEEMVIVEDMTVFAHWEKMNDDISDGSDRSGDDGETDGGSNSGGGGTGETDGGGNSGGGSGGDGFIGGGSETTDGDTFVIRTEEDFYKYIVEPSTMGKTFILANDLTLTGKHVVQYSGGPVDSSYHFPVAFYGTLRGNGHTIRLASSCTWIAIFGDLGGATIENITFVLTPQAAISESGAERTTFSNVLVSVGILTGGDLTKCTLTHCEVNYAGNRDNSYRDYVYGCFGDKADDCRFVDCKGTGVFPRTAHTSLMASVSVGGFVREAIRTTFEGCRFEGTVESNGGVGGIAANMDRCLVQNCEVKATIAGPLADGYEASGGSVGGIAGTLSSSTVQVCRVEGSVSQLRHPEENIGGIAGYAKESSLISLCFSSADIIGRENVGGVVGYLRDSDIENVLSSGTVKGRWNVGGCVGQSTGYASRRANIVCSTALGSVIGLAADPSEECRYLGGFAGHLEWSDVSWCCATGLVNCTGKSFGLGGFVGSIRECTRISTSYAIGSVVGGRLVGGFSGWVVTSSEYDNATIQIRNCYARGSATETTTSDSAGVAAFAASIGDFRDTILVANCYATGKVTAYAPDYDPFSLSVNTDALAQHGGLSPILGEIFGTTIGTTGSATSSYWDKQTTGQLQSGLMGEGKTTAEMGRQSTYVGWDFDTIWIMQNGYPVFRACPYCSEDPAALGTVAGAAGFVYGVIDGGDGGEENGDPTSTPTPTPESELEAVHELYAEVDGPAPATAASVYDGFLVGEGGVLAGTIQVKIGKPGKKDGMASATATVVLSNGKKKNLKAVDKGKVKLLADGPTEIEFVGGETCAVVVGSEGMSGYYGMYEVSGSRNFFSSKVKAEANAATEAIKPWVGSIAVIWNGGTASVAIDKKGKAKASVTLSNGAKGTVTSQVLLGDEWHCVPVMVTSKKMNVSFALWLPAAGGVPFVSGLGDDAIVGRAGALNDGAKFVIDKNDALWQDVSASAMTEYLPDGVPVSVKGTKWTLPKAGKLAMKKGVLDASKAGDNPSGLKLTPKKDGTFTGSFKVYYVERGGLKSKTATVAGIVVDGTGYGTATIKGVGTVAIEIR